MQPHMWGDRVFRRAAAARGCGLPDGTLGVLLHRLEGAETLYSERINGKRLFSARDVCVLRIAHELERAGQTWLTALARAYDNLQAPPAEHALLITPASSVSSKSSWITTVAPQPSDKTLIMTPIGRFCAEVLQALKHETVAV